MAVNVSVLAAPVDPKAIVTQCKYGITINWSVTGITNLNADDVSNNGVCDFQYYGNAPLFGSASTFNVETDITAGDSVSITSEQWLFGNTPYFANAVTKSADCPDKNPDPICATGKLQMSVTYTHGPAWDPSYGSYNQSIIDFRIWKNNIQFDITLYTNDSPFPPASTLPADQRGGQSDNKLTAYDGPKSCPRPGLPTYSVNTALLNLAVEDTDFAWQSFGHDIALRRVWNMQPGLGGMFGNGWSFAYESALRTTGSLTNGTPTVVKLGSGQEYSYTVAASQGQGTGTVTLSHSYGTAAIMPVLTGYISEATGTAYYTFEDKSSKLTSRYDYASKDAATGESIYNLTSIKDRNGNALTLTYDAGNRLTKITDASGRATAFSYDASNHVTQLTTINNKTATFGYDASGNLTRNVDLAGNVITYAYDANKLITSMTTEGKTTSFTNLTDANSNRYVSSLTDAMGNVTTYAFPTAGGTQVTEPGGGIRSYANSGGRTTSVKDQLGHTTSMVINNSNLLPSSTTDAQGRITKYAYDANGNITSRTDPAGKITTFVYDANWNITKTTDPLGNIRTFTYDANNNLTGTTSPLGLATTMVVDSKGLVTKITKPDASFATFAYDSHGNSTAITNPLGKTTTFGFDAYGLELVSATDPRTNTAAFSYDPNRLLTGMTLPDNSNIQYSYACNALKSSTDGGGNTTTIQRDNLLHATKITNPLSKFSSLAYNSDGFNTSVTDPLGKTTASGYDAAHRITSITNPLNKTILFGRNADGSPSSITDELGKATAMSYDNRGLLSSITDPLGNVTTKASRDDLGRVSSVTGARGKIVSTTYDQDGRATTKNYDGVTVATYGWNSVNQLTSVTDSTGVKAFTRDAAGQVTAITYPDGLALSLAYDNAGNASSISYPGGLVVSYSYDSQNRTSGVSFGVSSVALNYSATGRLAGETRSNSVQSTYGYDAAGQLTSLSHKKGTNVIADLSYTWNDAGLVIGESGTLPLTPAISSSSVTGTYNNADGVLTWGADNYTYDADGNLTGITGARIFSAAYDNQNRPTSIALGGTTATFVYDGLGNRVKAQTTTAARNFHHDPWGRLLFETDTSGLVTANYIYAGNRLIASGTTAGGYVFYHGDKTGNTLALTDSSGTVVGAFAYSPYGTVLNKSGSVTTPFTYVGAFGVMSEGNDLYFMKNRYYDAVTGRFIQRDPTGFAGGQSNLYAYVGGNPVTYVDPEGTGVSDYLVGLVTAGVYAGGAVLLGNPVTLGAAAAVGGTAMLVKKGYDLAKDTANYASADIPNAYGAITTAGASIDNAYAAKDQNQQRVCRVNIASLNDMVEHDMVRKQEAAWANQLSSMGQAGSDTVKAVETGMGTVKKGVKLVKKWWQFW